MKTLVSLIVVCFAPLFLSGQGARDAYGDRDDPLHTEIGAWQREIEDEYLLSQPLRAYPDAFSALSDYNFSFVRYRRRGYDWNMSGATVNGIDLDDRFAGGLRWNLLSAASSALHVHASAAGNRRSRNRWGTVGEHIGYEIGADTLREKIRVGWMFSDRRFRNGFRAEYASGWLPRGWALSASVTGRSGRDRHITGVYSDNWTYAFSLAKRFAGGHTLSLSSLGASTEQGVQGAVTAELFELSGERLYNPYWGYNGDEVYTSRVRSSFQPMVVLDWRWRVSPRFGLFASAAGHWGENAYSSLGWYDAPNPYPDYYRYLPSFWDGAVADAIREEWASGNSDFTGIDWRELSRINRENGDAPASYVIGSDVTDLLGFQAVAGFEYACTPTLRLEGGLRMRTERATRFRRLENLLDGAWLADVDQYLIDDEYFGDRLQNDVNNPHRRVLQGERYGYDYDLFHTSAQGWIAAEWTEPVRKRLSGYLGFRLVQTAYRREGRYEKELYPGAASFGSSATQRFTGYMLSGGVGYRFSPAHSCSLDVVCGERAPVAEAVFIAPDYRNRIIDDPRTSGVLGGELGYRFSLRSLEITLNGYITLTRREGMVRRYYDDIESEYADAVFGDVSKLYAGVELGLSVSLAPRLGFRMAASLAEHCFRSDPTVRIVSDRDGRVFAPGDRVYIKGYRTDASPLHTLCGELRYAASHYWTAALSVNYAGGRYASPDLLRRTWRVCAYASAPEAMEALTAQERLPDATTVDLFLSKSFRIREHFVSVSASVRNLTDRRDIVYDAYEQTRLRRTGAETDRTFLPFGNKYRYGYPRSYYLTVNYTF